MKNPIQRQNTDSHENFDVVEPVGMLTGREPRKEKLVEALTLNDGGPPKTGGLP